MKFKTLAFEDQESAGPSAEEFLKDLFISFCFLNNEPRAGCFWIQRISLAIEIAKAACVLVLLTTKPQMTKFFYL